MLKIKIQSYNEILIATYIIQGLEGPLQMTSSDLAKYSMTQSIVWSLVDS